MILPRYALYALMLAGAGLPIYLHAPKFYVDEYGVGLGAVGATLFAMRLLDVAQDPLLGMLAGRLRAWRAPAAGLAAAGLALGMIGLFAVTPPVAPLLWLALCLTVLFSSYSFLNILYYARGVAQAESMDSGPAGSGHVRLAAWRETGTLIGVSLASITPAALVWSGLAAPYAAFALGFAVLVLAAAVAMHPAWPGGGALRPPGFGRVLGDPEARALLLIGLVNAAPVAVASTLFLFFVEYRLEAPDLAGPFLVAFFLAAAAAAPVWSLLAQARGERRMLAIGMALSIASFAWAWTLGPGDTMAFFLVCLGSGAALGADMTLLPAIFARRVSQLAGDPGTAFGLWSFCAKFTLAAAAGAMLPALEASGFRPGGPNGADALRSLAALYALVPCALKLVALGLLTLIRPRETAPC